MFYLFRWVTMAIKIAGGLAAHQLLLEDQEGPQHPLQPGLTSALIVR